MAKVFTGTAGNDILNGSWGDDLINGGLGADTMTGGSGNDIYVVDNVGDVVREVPAFKISNDTAIQLASVTSTGTNGNGDSGQNAITISGNGNLVGFHSGASNLLPVDTNGLFVSEFNIRNMTTGGISTAHTTSGNTQPAQGLGGGPDNGYSAIHMTPDGRFVVFSSSSVGLIPLVDSTTDGDIFVKDLLLGTITIESEPTGAGVQTSHSFSPDISDNARFVVFTASNNLVSAPDTNGIADTDVYWRDRQTGVLRMVSGEFDGSVQGNSDSAHATVTNDGRLVLFESAASNFTTPGFDTLGNSDLFIRDMVADTVQMITGAADNVSLANGSSQDASITPNGRYVVFTSSASNLITGDTNASADIFRQDLATGAVIRVNTTTTGAQAGGGQHAQITPDGRYVVFESPSTTLVTVAGDLNNITKIFVKDLVTGDIEMVSRTSTGGALTGFSAFAPQISDDGRYIVFNTRAVLSPADSLTNDDVYRVPNPFYSAADQVRSSVTYTLPTGVENLVLTGAAAINGTGNALNNVLTGNTANNILNGGLGNDTMAGGLGNDTYVRNAAGDVVTEALNAGTDTVQSAVTYTLGLNVENLTLTGAAAINGSGNTLANVLTGNSGNNVLNGSTGTDTASYASATAGVTLDLGLVVAQNTVGAGTDTLIAIENLTGSNFNDILTGNTANNVLNGGLGNDTMAGGLGNDIYVRNAVGDVVTEALNAGTDTVQSAATDALGLNVENLTLTGAAAINGTGNTLANVLTGNSGNNVLNGGTGTDTASYASATAGVTVNLGVVAQNTVGAGTDTLIAIENLTGSNFNDTLTGNTAANLLNGGIGADTLIGGSGNDTYVVDNALDAISETSILATEIDTVQSGVTWALGANLERLTLTGAAAINGTGNSLNNVLTGNAATNFLDGGTGADTLIGGAGGDLYIVDNALDVISETSILAFEVEDVVQSSVNWTLGANLERLTLTGALAINGTGNSLANHLIGNGGNNVLTGGAGDDQLIGDAGADTLTGGAGADQFVLNSKVGFDSVTDFVSGTDQFLLGLTHASAGSSGEFIHSATLAGPGGFATTSDLVIVTGNIAGGINAGSAAAAIGSAGSAYAAGDTRWFAVDNGTASGLFLFTSSGADAAVSAAELTLMGLATSTPATVSGDYQVAF